MQSHIEYRDQLQVSKLEKLQRNQLCLQFRGIYQTIGVQDRRLATLFLANT